jgi:hypothetical protein
VAGVDGQHAIDKYGLNVQENADLGQELLNNEEAIFITR